MTCIELRRYVMHPGRRDELIDLFEREFIESQEACGMTAIGHFRDPADPDAYVWLREFPSVQARGPALEAFYDRSSVWKANRDAANATMIDSDNVLMLRPLMPASGFDLDGLRRPAAPGDAKGASVVAIAIFMLSRPLDAEFAAPLDERVLTPLKRDVARVAAFVTDETPNAYPRLPVRAGHALVIAGVCANAAAVASFRKVVNSEALPPAVRTAVSSEEVLLLEPAARSLLR